MTKFKAVIQIAFSLILSSCSKGDDIIETIGESDAIEIIQASLQANAGGFVTNIEDITEQLVKAVISGELCDSLYTKTLDENYNGAQRQATYTTQLLYEMACNNFQIPQTATFSSQTSATYKSSRIISDDYGDFSGNASGLQPSSSQLVVDGVYSRTGTYTLNFIEQKNILSTLTIDFSSLQIIKKGFEIESGKGIISLTGTDSGEAFSFQGSIIFKGGNTATIDIDGSTYDISWD